MQKISFFPSIPNDGSSAHSVVRPWMNTLSFKQQTVVLVALRGYDGVGKDDPSKPLIKALRMTVLQNADTSSSFMSFRLGWDHVDVFFESCHHYPLHWVMHFAHAAEILGYKHPDPIVRQWWLQIYFKVTEVLHVNPETMAEMDARLADNT